MPYFAPDEPAMLDLGESLAAGVAPGDVVYLQGELGMGKTTLARGILAGFGHTGRVTSPTYTLVEPYEFGGLTLYHIDLYRLDSPRELEMLGIRDITGGESVILVEWPDKGRGVLPQASCIISIARSGEGREVDVHAVNPGPAELQNRSTAWA